MYSSFSDPEEDLTTLSTLDQVIKLKNGLSARATGGAFGGGENAYMTLRRELRKRPDIYSRMPDFVRNCTNLDEFWAMMKEYPRYQERRQHVQQGFAQVIDDLENEETLAAAQKTRTDAGPAVAAAPGPVDPMIAAFGEYLRPTAPLPVVSQPVEGPKKPKVFIGHGHSPLWRELKDYLEDDLKLETVYFEQGSHVGEHMAEILNGFLAEATCAITLLTMDDEQADGRERARQNVVHETGFFQGNLGFKRVAMLVQRDVEEFSNVAGIVPLYFSGRHIKQTFADIMRWLKREGLMG